VINRIEKASLKIVNEGTLTVGLNTELTEELLMEGYIRDLVRGIQTLRKECGLDVTDRIKLYLSASQKNADNKELEKAFELFKDYVCDETLTVQSSWLKTGELTKLGSIKTSLVEAGDYEWEIGIEKNN